jgi:hypothetical protein
MIKTVIIGTGGLPGEISRCTTPVVFVVIYERVIPIELIDPLKKCKVNHDILGVDITSQDEPTRKHLSEVSYLEARADKLAEGSPKKIPYVKAFVRGIGYVGCEYERTAVANMIKRTELELSRIIGKP